VNCPHCGADTKNAVTLCPLCGKTLDRGSAYAGFVAKADAAAGAGEYEKAAIAYNKALEYAAGTEDVYLKLASAYTKLGSAKAANAYMKALSCNFYNDTTHNMLISLYTRFGKLDELKKWYEQSRPRVDPVFADKYIKIIDNVKLFSSEKSARIPASKNTDYAAALVFGLKKYAMMNLVLGLVVIVASVAVGAAVFMGVNTNFVLMFSVFFIFVSVIVSLAAKRKKKKPADEAPFKPEDIMNEFNVKKQQ